MSWPDLIPAAVLAAVLMTVPGAIPLAVLGLRPLPVLTLAPVTSIALVAVSAVVASLVDARWGPVAVGVAVLVTTGVALAVRLLARRRLSGFAPGSTSAASWRESLGASVQYLAGLAAIAVAMATPLMKALVSPLSIAQRFDNAFHLNAIAYAASTGQAAPWDISVISGGPFYPPAFHDQVALLLQLMPDVPLSAAVHAVMLTILLLAWPLSMALLVEAAIRPGPAARLLTAPLAFSFTAFPLNLLDWGMIYPNILGFALVPALIALVLELVRRRTAGQVPPLLVLPLLAVAIVGAALAHPNAAFSAALLCVPIFVTGIVRLRRGDPSQRLRIGFLAAGAALMIAAWVVFAPSLGTADWLPVQTQSQAVGEALTGTAAEKPGIWTGTVLLLLGLVAVLRTRKHLWLLGTWALAALVYLAATAWDPGLWRDLVSGMLYRDQFRAGALLVFAWVPVAAFGVQTVAGLAARASHRLPRPLRSRGAGAVAALLAAVLVSGLTTSSHGFAERMEQVRDVYVSDNQAEILSPAEFAMFDTVEELVPPDATLLVDPWDGSSLAYAFTGRDVTSYYVFEPVSPEVATAVSGIADVAEDPEVCSALEETGADYVLSFGDVEMYRGDEDGDFDELENLSGTEGLDRIARHGDAFLYEITACD